MKKIQGLLVLVAAIALIAVGFLASRLLESGPEVTVSATSIEERLTRCSSLTTARLEYRGLVKYEEGDIPLINKKAFSMIYDAQISAGIDLENAQVEISGRDISITLPEPAVQDITIDPDSLEFYDEQFALFNCHGGRPGQGHADRHPGPGQEAGPDRDRDPSGSGHRGRRLHAAHPVAPCHVSNRIK